MAPESAALRQSLHQERQSTLDRKPTGDDLELFEALHQLRILEHYRGHMLCQDPISGVLWDRMVQGYQPLPENMSAAVWRTSVDEWIDKQAKLTRFGTVSDGSLVYRFWKQVLAEILVPRPNVTKLRSADRKIHPAITSPTPDQIRNSLVAIAGCLNRGKEFLPSEQLVVELLEEIDMIERDVVYYSSITGNEKIVYPGPFVRCTRDSAKQLNAIGRRYHLKGARLADTRVAAEFVLATAKHLGVSVPEFAVAFPQLQQGGHRAPSAR